LMEALRLSRREIDNLRSRKQGVETTVAAIERILHEPEVMAATVVSTPCFRLRRLSISLRESRRASIKTMSWSFIRNALTRYRPAET